MKNSIYKSDVGHRKIKDHYETYIKSFSTSFHREYVPTRFGTTHVLVGGPTEGKPLIILQGGNCINPMTLSWFRPLLETYRVYAPDTIGHPGFSDQTRISASDESFAHWVVELMEHFQIEKSAFIGPSYGAGIILRVATHAPKKIECAVLVSPSGIELGSKFEMVRKIIVPLLLRKLTSSEKHLRKITDIMSEKSMKEEDRIIIGDIFKHVRLEQEMPKLTEKDELLHYDAPTLIIAGKNDIFFPGEKLKQVADEIISNLITYKTLDMGHYPSEDHLVEINEEIISFLDKYYLNCNV